MGYILLFILFIAIVFCIAGLYTAFNVGLNKKKPDIDILKYKYPWHEPDYEKKIKQWIKNIPLNYVKIKSPYQYRINALSIKNNDKEKWVIILHGVTLNHKAVMDLAYMYSEMDYNVLLWDLRY